MAFKALLDFAEIPDLFAAASADDAEGESFEDDAPAAVDAGCVDDAPAAADAGEADAAEVFSVPDFAESDFSPGLDSCTYFETLLEPGPLLIKPGISASDDLLSFESGYSGRDMLNTANIIKIFIM